MRILFGRAVMVASAALWFGMCQPAMGLAAAPAQPLTASSTGVHLLYRGTVNIRRLAARLGAQGTPALQGGRFGPLHVKSAAAAGVRVPNPSNSQVAPGAGGAPGFVGLTAADSGALNGFPVEPPDQGLCAHAGMVMEAVNLAVQVFDENGAAQAPAVSLNAFFGLPPVVMSAHGTTTFGPFLSDPRCYYDAQTKRWFVTSLEIDVNPYTGDLGYRSSELLAVSQTSDPLGAYGLFSADTTNDGIDGTPPEPNCPCFGDQPRIGADAHGFYLSTDSYPIHGTFNSNGGELYAASKQGLAAAASGTVPPPVLVAIHNGAVIIGGHPANAVQPAETPIGGHYASDREYFMSTPDYNGFATMGGQGANAVVLWVLSHTSTLASSSPSVTLTNSILPSEPFAPPVNAAQKPGPLPLGSAVNEPLAPLNVDDDRMQQVEYVNGKLYSSLETGIGAHNKADRTGSAWFEVTPHGVGGAVTGQGYVAIGHGASTMYPAIGLDSVGNGVLTFSVSGPTYYPSAAWMRFAAGSPSGPIWLTAQGAKPEDGFSCYKAFGGGPACRWGDYSAASSDGAGTIVMGDEMIANVARDPGANWDTFISTLKP